MLDRHVGGILDAVAALDGALADSEAALEQRSLEREQLIQERWRLRKELAALVRVGEQYDALSDSHDAVVKRQTVVREALQTLLKDVKALTGELRRGN